MRLPFLALLLTAALSSVGLRADEGMWTFDNLPLQQLKEKYQFVPSSDWIDTARLAAVSLGGCSGSFVSADGLVLTNHHCVRSAVQRVSSKDKDLLKNSFIAASRADEVKIPGLSWRTLMAMENITERLAKVAKPGMNETAVSEARSEEIELIKAELEKKTGLSYRSVSLYQGGETWMYGYKVFNDIRLVAVPEIALAMFGGDYDNFTYPRHELDFALLRVYDQDKPYRPTHFLKFSREGLKLGDLTFVVGHPGRTNRFQTLAQMKFDRDFNLPEACRTASRQLAGLEEYAKRNGENARRVQTMQLGISNGLKANQGALAGLQDDEVMRQIEQREQALRAAVAKNRSLTATTGQSWTKIERALRVQQGYLKESRYLTGAISATLGQALSMIRIVEQEALPEGKRLVEFQRAEGLKAAKARVAHAPHNVPNPELELLQLTRGLDEALKDLGAQHEWVKVVLGGKSPEVVAKALLENTKLTDAKARAALLESGREAVLASSDPMLQLARKLEPMVTALRKKQEETRAIIEEHSARIARARFQIYGKKFAPDATGTLRLSYGTVDTYAANGTLMQPFTTFMGLYDRHFGWGGNDAKAYNGEWMLPQRWLDGMGKLDLKTPFNFSHAVDTTGGNSGSPVIDRRGELVGLLFDGNIESNAGRYFFDPKRNRSVSVDVRAIIEALTKLYDANHLVKELKGE